LKKKILILTSRVGRGHVSASQAVVEILEKDYQIVVGNFMKEVLSKYDIFSLLTRKKHTAEDVYCFFVKIGMNRVANFIYQATLKVLQWSFFRQYFVNNAIKYFQKTKPDLIISVIGYVNYRVAEAAEKLSIPFIIIPTDLDQTIASCGFEKKFSPKVFSSLNYAISCKDNLILKTLKNVNIPEKQIHEIGFPLRSQFFEKKDINHLKKKWKVPHDKKVICLLLGSIVNRWTYTMVKTICGLKEPYHIIVYVNHNTSLKKTIEKFQKTSSCSLTIIPFINEISDIMAISDLLIIKPGSNTFVESFTLKKPIIIDLIHRVSLKIEEFNCRFLKEKKLGFVVKKKKEIINILNHWPETIDPLNTSDLDFSQFSKKLLSLIKKSLKQQYQ
jgi:processive 1,2-diacylglycerol beta-glucosyltransferase